MAKHTGIYSELSGRCFKNEKMIDSFRGEIMHLLNAAEDILENLENSSQKIDVAKIEAAEESTKNLIERICYLKGLYS